MDTEPGVILIVDDREDDVLLIQRAFKLAAVDNPMQVAQDGEEAIAYLSGEGKFSNRTEFPLPWLVLLDLKMPKISGHEVLAWVRSRPAFKSIVIVVLTSSEDIRDVNEAYRRGANSFLVKPLEFENTVELAKVIRSYWLQHNRFPTVEGDQPEGCGEGNAKEGGSHPL